MKRDLFFSLALVGVLSACAADPSPPSPGRQVVGLIELQIGGLGGEQPTSAVRALPLPGRAVGAQALTNQGAGLQLSPLTLTVFNTGTRGTDGMRYVSATYAVRNAASDGTPSARARTNLTLLAVSAGDTVDGTAFRAVTTFGGTAVPAGVARTFLPTHAMRFDPLAARAVLSPGAEDLQVYTEAEVASGTLQPDGGGTPLTYGDLGVNTVFPYGFLVHTVAGGRTLAANPAANTFDGRVTFSVKLPQQATGAQDPWAFRVVLLVVEDSVTSVTQSLEEQAQGNTLAGARATAVNATRVNVLPGSTYPAGVNGGVTTRCVTKVRTGGLVTDATPTYLVNGVGCP